MWSWHNRNRTRVFRTERQHFVRYSTKFVFNARCVWYLLPNSYICVVSCPIPSPLFFLSLRVCPLTIKISLPLTLLTWEKNTRLSPSTQLQFCVLEQRSLGTRLLYVYIVPCIMSIKVLKQPSLCLLSKPCYSVDRDRNTFGYAHLSMESVGRNKPCHTVPKTMLTPRNWILLPVQAKGFFEQLWHMFLLSTYILLVCVSYLRSISQNNYKLFPSKIKFYFLKATVKEMLTLQIELRMCYCSVSKHGLFCEWVLVSAHAILARENIQRIIED